MSNYQRGKIKREYDSWYSSKYPNTFKKDTDISRVAEAQLLGTNLQLLSEVLQRILKKVVLKLDFTLDPVVVNIGDESREIASRATFDFGKIELGLDELYQKRHFLKCMGIKLESKRTLSIFKALLQVSKDIYQNLDIQAYKKVIDSIVESEGFELLKS